MSEQLSLDTFDILGVANDEYVYASLIAWVLDPTGEHGLGDRLLRELVRFLGALGVEWSPDEVDGEPRIVTRVRVNDHGCGIVVRGAEGAGVVIVFRLFAGGAVTGLDKAREAGIPVIGLGYGPSAFPGEVALPVWRLQALASALRDLPGEGRFAPLLFQLRTRLIRGRPRGTLNAPATFHATPLERLDQTQANATMGSTLVEQFDAEMLLSEDMSRAYVVGTLLGEGGQGAVYRALVRGEQHFTGFANPIPQAVIKVAHSDYAANLNREGDVYARGDPNLVCLLDRGTTAPGRPYLIMERLHRLPHERLGERPLGVTVDIFVNLLQALHELAFQRGNPMVLCDVKPENILLRMPGSSDLETDEYMTFLYEGSYEPVFADVGCAQDVAVLEDSEGVLNEMIGTPVYLPPEAIPLLSGRGGGVTMGTYSRKTDVYSLTLAFYELLTGTRPYVHLPELTDLVGRERLLELFHLKKKGVSPIDKAALELSAGEATNDVLQILEAGLAPNPDERATAAKLLSLTEKLFDVRDHRARPERYLYDGPVALRRRQQRFRS